MASTVHSDSDDGMDAFMDKFKTQRYKNAFSENGWEEVRLACGDYVHKIEILLNLNKMR